ncbi:flagellar hook-length control protein FliK [Paenibacillus sp. GSMTC-2017]|uniref:flagellar hook-length control protein FliK n=1 Tax=Paenibacillus sp. GSMTC-2017 TaxID=2794350 RepID=UPI0018D9D6CF|nr:flagellar hook-length control protein FliK [Paenibacillus sp. GSMTC-2017]MBH5316639.1 flagellar hook-length control protein FliK [Paenibacillus sp. GSMTC-2017]
MEMMIPTTVSTPQQSTASTSVSGSKQGAEASDDFQQVLVQQIVSNSDNGQAVNESSPLVAVINQLGAITTATNGETQLLTEDVMAMIDGLVDSLEVTEGEEQSSHEPSLEELEAMLEQLNALLSLLGIPLPEQEFKATNLIEGSSNAEHVELATIEVKSALQNSLLQLQVLLQQGPLSQIKGQEPLSIIANELQAFAAGLAEEVVGQGKKSDKALEGAPAWLNVQASTTKDAGVHLQRLSQQAIHPSLFNVTNTAASNQPATEQGTTVLTAAENVIASPVSFIVPDQTREFAPLLAKTTVATEFVVAENFAETMNGLIVQKFDVRTLNGMSEAKLILFPEHLGQVDVKISMQNGLLTAVFQADTAMAKDLLDNQMAQLRAALQAQGLTVEKLEVTQSTSASQLTNQHPGQGNQGQQSSNNGQGFRDDKNVRDTAFESEMVEQAAIHGLGYGRSINETA